MCRSCQLDFPITEKVIDHGSIQRPIVKQSIAHVQRFKEADILKKHKQVSPSADIFSFFLRYARSPPSDHTWERFVGSHRFVLSSAPQSTDKSPTVHSNLVCVQPWNQCQIPGDRPAGITRFPDPAMKRENSKVFSIWSDSSAQSQVSSRAHRERGSG